MAATYTKLKSGEWGIRVQGETHVGACVEVTTKSGKTKIEYVKKIVWQGNGVAICALKSKSPSHDGGESYGRSQRSIERTYRNKYGWDGVRGSSSYYTSGMYDEES